MIDIVITLRNRKPEYLDNIRKNYPEVWDILKPDMVIQGENVIDKTRVTYAEIEKSLEKYNK